MCQPNVPMLPSNEFTPKVVPIPQPLPVSAVDMPTPELSNGICTALAALPPGAHLDASALARILGRCTKSVQRAARRGELPPPIKFMGRHVWMAGAVQDHFAARQAAALRAADQREKRIRLHSP